jgi:hypothetical protein
VPRDIVHGAHGGTERADQKCHVGYGREGCGRWGLKGVIVRCHEVFMQERVRWVRRGRPGTLYFVLMGSYVTSNYVSGFVILGGLVVARKVEACGTMQRAEERDFWVPVQRNLVFFVDIMLLCI